MLAEAWRVLSAQKEIGKIKDWVQSPQAGGAGAFTSPNHKARVSCSKHSNSTQILPTGTPGIKVRNSFASAAAALRSQRNS